MTSFHVEDPLVSQEGEVDEGDVSEASEMPDEQDNEGNIEEKPDAEEVEKQTKKKRMQVKEKETNLGWTATASLYREEFQCASKVLAMDKLVIDYQTVHGQTRKISQAHVNTIVESFTVRPPLDMVDALVWNDGGMLLPTPYKTKTYSIKLITHVLIFLR